MTAMPLASALPLLQKSEEQWCTAPSRSSTWRHKSRHPSLENYDTPVPTMRFAAFVVGALQLAAPASAFSPGSTPAVRRAGGSSSSALSQSLRDLVLTEKPRSLTTSMTAPMAPVIPEIPLPANPVTNTISEEEVRALFELWNAALATGDSRIVADRYIKKPVLLPTVSDQPRTDFDSVKDYFDAFLLKKPQGKILEGNIHIGEGWASVSAVWRPVRFVCRVNSLCYRRCS